MRPWRTRDAGSWARQLREVELSEPLADAVGIYLALLGHWSSAVDLVGEADADDVVRLVRESLAALPWVGEPGTLLDVGSGNGLPAVPLLVARPGLHGTLLEPRERRWAFLQEVVRELDLSASVKRERVAQHVGGPYTVVTVRGVAPGTWLPHADRLLHSEGTLLWWTSTENAADLAEKVPEGRVLTCPLPESGRGCLAAWRRCST